MASPGTPNQWLDPSVLQGLGLGAPAPEQQAPFSPAPGLASFDPSAAMNQPQGPAPGAPPVGIDSSIQGAPGAAPSLPQPVVDAIGNGFAPEPTMAQQPQVMPVPTITKNVPTTEAGVAKANKQYDQAQAKQQAIAASPQGMQQQAMLGQVAATQDQGKIAVAQGDETAKQAEEAAAIKDKQIADQAALQQQQQARFDAQQKQREQLFGDTQKAVAAAAKQVVDPNRYWNNKSTGAKVAAGIGVLLAGIGQGLNGDKGANPAMKLITDSIDRDVEAQKSNMAQGNAVVGMRRDLATDYSHLTDKQDEQYNLQKAQGRQMAADQIDASAAHFASPQAKLAAQQQSALLRGQAQQIIGQFADKKVAEQQHAADQKQQLKEHQMTVGLGYAQLQREKDNDKINQAQKQEEIDDKKEFQRGQLDAKAKGKLTGDDAKFAISAPTEGTNGAYAPLRNADGAVWTGSQDKDRQGKTADMTQAVITAHRLAGDLQRAIDDHGGEVGYFKSDDWQQKQSKYEEYVNELRDQYGIKRPSEQASEMFGKIASGNVDPSSMLHDISKTLKQSDEDAQSRLDDRLRVDHYTGPKLALPDYGVLPKATPTAQDDQVKQITKGIGERGPGELSPDDMAYVRQLPAYARHAGGPQPGDETNPAVIRAQKTNLAPSQLKAFDNLQTDALSGDPKVSGKALSALQDQAANGATVEARRYAESVINVIQVQGVTRGDAPEAGIRTSYSARDDAPPPLPKAKAKK